MDLELSIVSYHRLSPDQTPVKRLAQGGTIGRAEQSDWHLPDPERVISGTHARIERRGSDYYISDLSTNGLFINRSADPLGRERVHKLEQGDLITLGDYEIEVSIGSSVKASPQQAPAHDPFTPPAPANKGLNINSNDMGFNAQAGFPDIQNPVPSQHRQPTPQVSADMADFFAPPNQMNMQSAAPAISGMGSGSSAIPDDWNFGAPEPKPAPIHIEPAIVPTPTPVQPVIAPIQSVVEPVQPVVAPQPQSSAAPAHQASAPAISNDAIAAFLDGLGIAPHMLPANVDNAWWHTMGASMQEMLLGLMSSLRNRAELKSEFRINQTTFQQKENNPLKFSASIDDAFYNLFNRTGGSFMSANQAIKESFKDIVRHDAALIAGTHGALTGLLTQLSPDGIENNNHQGSKIGSVLGGNKSGRYWKTYRQLYADIDNDFKKQGQAAFSDDFVQAYDLEIKKNEHS